MSLFKNKSVKENLIGNIHILKKVNGYSAYDLAVNEGFNGTLQEWLKSLKGEKGDPGTLESHSEVDALGHRVINVANPVEDTDAVSFGYFKKYINVVKHVFLDLEVPYDDSGIANMVIDGKQMNKDEAVIINVIGDKESQYTYKVIIDTNGNYQLSITAISDNTPFPGGYVFVDVYYQYI